MSRGAATASWPQSRCRRTRIERNSPARKLSKIAARAAFVMSRKIAIHESSGALQIALSRADYEVRSRLEHIRDWAWPLRPFGSRTGHQMMGRIGIRPIVFSINCYIVTVLALFIAFSLDLKTPAGR